MKTLRFLFAFVLLAIANNTNAQFGYQSFLNGDTVQWNIENDFEGGGEYYVFYANDIFYIDSVPCKKLNCLSVYNRNGDYYYQEYPNNTRQYLCEDTITGRLWMYFCNNSDTTHFTKKLLVDMSLNVGDTFSLPLYNYRGYYDDDTLVYIVDTIKNINGKKHIFMSYINARHEIANIFIEGVGSVQYLFFPIASHYSYLAYYGQEERFLLCHFKDGNIDYNNNYYFSGGTPNLSDCFPPVSGITQVGSSHIKITAYPNPTKDRVTLEFGEAPRFNTLRLVNTAGATVLETSLTGHEPQHTLQLKGLPAGIYSCILSGKDGTATEKIVVE